MLVREIVLFLVMLVPVLRSQTWPSDLNFDLDAFTTTDDELCDQQLLEFFLSLMAEELWALERRFRSILKVLESNKLIFSSRRYVGKVTIRYFQRKPLQCRATKRMQGLSTKERRRTKRP